MAENKLKTAPVAPPTRRRPRKKGQGFMNGWSGNAFWLFENLHFVFYVALLAVVYIANSNYAFQNVQLVKQLQLEINKISWESNFKKSELMFESTQARVAEKVHHVGLRRLDERPEKIILTNE